MGLFENQSIVDRREGPWSRIQQYTIKIKDTPVILERLRNSVSRRAEACVREHG
jgi:hypothetical protein